MTLKAKISKILEGEFLNYYTEREEIELAIAQLLALFEKETRKIIFSFDDNPTYGGLINFASNAPESKDIGKAKLQAFNYGFRLGYQTYYYELSQRAKLAKLIKKG